MAELSQPETTVPRRVARATKADARGVLISMNPRAGSRSKHEHVEAIATALRQANFDVHVTTNLDELHGLGSEGLKSGRMRAVVAVGGDGTASVVRNHVPLELPLLIVPMGTENLLGRYVGQQIDPTSVCDVMEHGVVAELDLGKAGDKYFLIMVSAGFDAEVIRSLHENRHGNISHANYFLPTVRSMFRYDYPQIRLYCDSETVAGGDPQLCRWLFGFNLPLYALGLPIAPNAVATDGLFDVCSFERGTVWSVARYLWHIARSAHHALPDAGLRQTPHFRLEPFEDTKIPYQLDGDYGGTLPVDVDVLPGQLRLLVSRETAGRLGMTVSPDL